MRAWPVRGLLSAPAFGVSVSDLLTESTVSFERPSATRSHGGFTAGTAVVFLTIPAHVEEASEPAGPYALQQGVVQRRLVRAYFNFPDASRTDVTWLPSYGLPVKGDWLLWTTSLGVVHHLPIRVVIDPENAHDHLEIETELFE